MIELSMGARPRARQTLVAIALVAAVAAGCASKGGSTQTGAGSTSVAAGGTVVSSPANTKEPDRIVVQHILIGFVGSVPGKKITRSQEEAKKLAYELLDRAKKGEDFDELVRANTDDQFPGRYGMANRGVTPAGGDEYARDGMVPAFGDVGFKLAVGDVGVADYDARTSPYGFHVIKRVQ